MTDVVRAAVSDAVRGRYGPIVRWDGPYPREWSWQFHADTAGRGPTSLVIKVPKWEETPDLDTALAAGPQEDTRAEFDALTTIRDAVLRSGDAGLAVVVPVAYVPEVNAIVMERLNARPLRSLLGWRRDGDLLGEVFARLGRWLALFHDLGATDPEPFDGRGRPVPILPVGSPVLVEASDRLAAVARRLDGVVSDAGTIHGDLTLGNVLVTIDHRVAVIDPNRSSGRPSQDSAHLLTEVRLGRGQLLTAGRLRPPRTVARWRDALVASQPRLDPRVLRHDEAAAAMERWRGFTESSHPVGVRWLAERIFSAEVNRLLDAC